MPVPLLKVKEGYSSFQHTTPQQCLEYKLNDYFNGREDVSSDSGIGSTDSELQETPDVDASKQKAPYCCSTEQAIGDSNSVCFDGRPYLCKFRKNYSACYSSAKNSCLNTDELEFLNQAYEFYAMM